MGSELTKHFSIHTKEWQTTEKEVNNELDKQRQRYKPEGIKEIVSKTGFSKKEIQILYRSFKENCPNGMVTKQKFMEIYSDFFYFGDATGYANLVFNTFDEDGNGEISFEVNIFCMNTFLLTIRHRYHETFFKEFVQGLSNLWRGTLEEKLSWIFALYDFDHKGFITERNLVVIIQSIYNMVGHSVHPFDHTVDHARDVFQKMDANHDGIITLEEFVECCSQDETICESLDLFKRLLYTFHTEPVPKLSQINQPRSKVMFC